jgi:hypothetical protein
MGSSQSSYQTSSGWGKPSFRPPSMSLRELSRSIQESSMNRSRGHIVWRVGGWGGGNRW